MSEIYKSFSPEKFYVEYKVEKRLDDYRLDQFVQHYFPTFSREFIKKKVAKGEITIKSRNHTLKPSTRVRVGDIVTFTTWKKELEDEYWLGEKVETEQPQIIFEDSDLLVISKPPFMVTHPTGRHLFNTATTYYEKIYGHTIHSLHRLDRETSGVLLLGKNPTASHQVTSEFENSQVKKCYFFIAKISDNFPQQFPHWAHERLGRMDDLDDREINEDDENRLTIKVHPQNSEQGKHASTLFEKIHSNEIYILALAFPQTGRQHQIRAHANFHGMPLIGDKLYLGNAHLFGRFKDKLATAEDHELMELPRQALHAVGIQFSYKGKNQQFFAPLPLDIKDWITRKFQIDIKVIEEKIHQKMDAYFNNSLR